MGSLFNVSTTEDESSIITSESSSLSSTSLSPDIIQGKKTSFSPVRSKVWKYFTKTEDRKTTSCLLCGKNLTYSASHSTSSMHKHLRSVHHLNIKLPALCSPSKRVKRVYGTPSADSDPNPEQLPTSPLLHGASPPPESSENESITRLKWMDHVVFMSKSSISSWEHAPTDVTIVGGDLGHHVKAHKMLLSYASPLLNELLSKTPPGQHPCLFLKDACSASLQQIINFLYKGEISLQECELLPFVNLGRDLQLRVLKDWNLTDRLTVVTDSQ